MPSVSSQGQQTLAIPSRTSKHEPPVLADGSIKNEDGNTAESGIGGERTINDYVAALTSAHNLEELEFALEKLAAQKEPAIDKAALVQGGMAKKRSSKDIWSKDIQAKFMKLVQSL